MPLELLCWHRDPNLENQWTWGTVATTYVSTNLGCCHYNQWVCQIWAQCLVPLELTCSHHLYGEWQVADGRQLWHETIIFLDMGHTIGFGDHTDLLSLNELILIMLYIGNQLVKMTIFTRFVLLVQLTISQYCFRYYLGAKWATSHYLNQWWPSLLLDIYITRFWMVLNGHS